MFEPQIKPEDPTGSNPSFRRLPSGTRTSSFKRCCVGYLKKRGFTLLEVLIALAVISIVLVAVISLQGQTIGMYESVRFYSQAPFLAQSKLSQAALDPRAISDGESGDFGKAHPGYTWQVQVSENELRFEDQPPIRFDRIEVRVKRASDGLAYTLIRYQSADSQGL